MNYLKQIQTGIDFIEANLDSKFTLADVAKAANMSQWHYQRIFKALTNETLKFYIRSRRIANSLDSLLNTEQTILDIAIDSGFESHESYTRAFQKMFAMSPSDYRKKSKKSLILHKPQIDTKYLDNLTHNICLEPNIIQLPKRHYVGIKTTIFGVESEKNNLSEKVPQLWESFVPRMTSISSMVSDFAYGLIQQVYEPEEQLEYVACVEVDNIESIPDSMVAITLEAQKYAQFTHKGFVDVDNLNETINYIYSNWLLNSDMHHTYQPDLEIYGPEFKMQSEDSIIYYAIPVTSTHNYKR